jgi:hypothetical protein
MSDVDDQHAQVFVLDLVNEAIISNPDPATFTVLSVEFLESQRPGCRG